MINKSYRFNSHSDADAFAQEASCLVGVETVTIDKHIDSDIVGVDVSMTEVPLRLPLLAMWYRAEVQ